MKKTEIVDYEKKREFIDKFLDDDVCSATEQEAKLYRDYSEELAKVDDLVALEAIAYGCYCGNKAFEIDYFRAEKILKKLMNISGKPKYANTLGYIYYYGRTTDGKPDYSKAFEYYSLGAIGGIDESVYKVCDIIMKGDVVDRNLKYVEYTLVDLYHGTFVLFDYGEYLCKFGDTALRIAGFLKQMIEEKQKFYEEYDYQDVFKYYLQAKYAVEKRIENENYVGDKGLLKRINESVDSIKQFLQINQDYTCYKPKSLQDLFENNIMFDGDVEICVTSTEDGGYKLKFSMLSFIEEPLEAEAT